LENVLTKIFGVIPVELWREILQRSGIIESYVPIENLAEALTFV